MSRGASERPMIANHEAIGSDAPFFSIRSVAPQFRSLNSTRNTKETRKVPGLQSLNGSQLANFERISRLLHLGLI